MGSSKGLEELAKLHKLKQLHLSFLNDKKSQLKLCNAFSSLRDLRKVTIGGGGFHGNSPGPSSAIFVKALVKSNQNLKEITSDTWEGGVKISSRDKNILLQKNIKLNEEYGIPDSDEESDEWSDDDDDDAEVSDEDPSSENGDIIGGEDSSDSEGSVGGEEILAAGADEEEILAAGADEEGDDAGEDHMGRSKDEANVYQVLWQVPFSPFTFCSFLLRALLKVVNSFLKYLMGLVERAESA